MQPNKQALIHVYSRQQYATKQFWDARYRQRQSYFDWYAQFPQLKQTFQKQYEICHQDNILMLGCGNSKLSQQMYQAGYLNIFNIDISPAVIEQMKKASQQKGYNKMRWEVMDATDMKQIQDQTFDVIIDKGTLDALISGQNIDICVKMLRQSMRVLKKDGQFILITYGSPEGRKKFFQSSIGLSKFDYYFTRVDLSSMSTLINLMRSNLGNKPLSSITKNSEAMKKSLMEFNLIKVLRRNRKNQKKYIIWSDIIKNPPNQNENIFQKETKKQEDKKEYENQLQKLKQPKNQEVNKQESKQSKKINYGPKKQSFCYVYSIRRKFAIDIEEIIKTLDYQSELKELFIINNEGNRLFKGQQSSDNLGVYPEGCDDELNKSLLYLKRTGIINNSIIIYSSKQNYNNGKQQKKFIIRQGKQNTIPVYTKSVFQIKFPCKQNQLFNIELKMKAICQQLIDNGGIKAYPSPIDYAYLGIIAQKLHIKSKYYEYLKQIWFPTYRFVSFSENYAYYQISAPPKLEQNYVLQQIKKKIGIKELSLKLVHKGYINYFDPKVISIMNFCSTTYAEGLNVNILAQQYPSGLSQQYHTYQSTLFMKIQTMNKFLARILSVI